MEKNNKKAWYKRWYIWLIIIILIIAIGSAMGGNTPESSDSSNNASSNQEEKKEQKTEFAVGETATFDDRSITVTKVERDFQTGNQFSTPETGKEFVLITVEIRNDGKSTFDFNTFEFKLQDSNGVQQSEDFTAISEGRLSSGSLAPGGKITGNMAFQVPAGDSGLKLLYESLGFFNNKVVTFNL